LQIENNMFEAFFNGILSFPMWVKQTMYVKIKENLENELQGYIHLVNAQDQFQLYVPTLTYRGKNELKNREHVLGQNYYTFLLGVSNRQNIIEMTLNNFWTLEESSKLFIDCMQKELVHKPDKESLEAIAAYMAGKIRLGEFFKTMGKMDVGQLEQALRIQKEREQKTGEKTKIAAILIEMGIITQEDTKILLMLKEEAKKRFILDFGIGGVNSDIMNEDDSIITLQRNIKQLAQENKILKDRLRKILNITE